MASFNTYVTDAGRALIALAEATAGTINFLSVGTGSGTLVLGQTPTGLTALVHQVDTWTIDGSNALTPYQVTVQFTVNSSLLTTTYANTEVGLFARIGSSGAATLLWYGYTTSPDTYTPSGTSNATIDVNQLAIVFTNATTCIATQTPSITVPPHAITHITGGFDPIPTASSTSSGATPITPNDVSQVLLGGLTAAYGPVPVATSFKPGGLPLTPSDVGQVPLGGPTASWGPVPLATVLRPGATLALTNNQNQSWRGDGSWQATPLVLLANITLYVSASGNNSTALPNDILHPWSTIQGALNFLSNYFISTGLVANILVGPGIFTTPFNVQHPQGSQIFITGTTSSATATSASFSGGTITLTGPSGTFSTFLTGDMIGVTSGQGAVGAQISGCWVVTSASSTTITYATAYGALAAGAITGGVLSGVNSIAVTRLQTVCFTISAAAVINESSLGGLNNLAIRYNGSAPSDGIIASNNSIVNLSVIGFYGWVDSLLESSGVVSISGSIVSCYGCWASRCTYGFVASTGTMSCNGCFATSNYEGYQSQTSFLGITNSYAVANTNDGFSAVEGGKTSLSNCYAFYNVRGVTGGTGGQILEGNGGSFTGNTTDIYLNIMALYLHTSGTTASYSTISSNITAANRLTADGCYFAP